MAAVIKYFKSMKTFTTQNMQIRFVTTKQNRIKMNRDRKIGPTIDSSANSLAAKGFLRSQKEYKPPENVSGQIEQIFSETIGLDKSAVLNNQQKFKFLSVCGIKTGHHVPNSLLHTIQSLEDAINFYQTPVNTTLPLDAIRNNQQLPRNLHIQYEYIRFHPDTDTMFNGVSAFPQSSTLVTGLKTRKKYTGYIAKKPWPS